MKKLYIYLSDKWWAETPLLYKHIQKFCIVIGAAPMLMPDNVKNLLPGKAFVAISVIGFLGAFLAQFKAEPNEAI